MLVTVPIKNSQLVAVWWLVGVNDWPPKGSSCYLFVEGGTQKQRSKQRTINNKSENIGKTSIPKGVPIQVCFSQNEKNPQCRIEHSITMCFPNFCLLHSIAGRGLRETSGGEGGGGGGGGGGEGAGIFWSAQHN